MFELGSLCSENVGVEITTLVGMVDHVALLLLLLVALLFLALPLILLLAILLRLPVSVWLVTMEGKLNMLELSFA